MTLAATGALRCRHLPDDGIQWLLVKPDVLHQAMCPALYHPIHMAIKIAGNLPAFFVSLISLLVTTVANDHVMVHIN
jgi:hypothetical protein